jgi:hypothetical protein
LGGIDAVLVTLSAFAAGGLAATVCGIGTGGLAFAARMAAVAAACFFIAPDMSSRKASSGGVCSVAIAPSIAESLKTLAESANPRPFTLVSRCGGRGQAGLWDAPDLS